VAAALPFAERAGGPLAEIPGAPPAPGEGRNACAFAPRCPFARPECRAEVPALRWSGAVEVACVLYPPEAA
jgi:oligopeptide/dipeptide ABC transporter ATP-binding protein